MRDFFASPGIDSPVGVVGVGSSGAGAVQPEHVADNRPRSPWDWFSLHPGVELGGDPVRGNVFNPPQDAKGMRNRKRGISPWDGATRAPMYQSPGGIVDLNVGADRLIAGGKGAASSLVRLHGRRADSGMKLPVLPTRVVRGGSVVTPAGGQHPGFGPQSPLMPRVPGLKSVINVIPASPDVSVPKPPSVTRK